MTSTTPLTASERYARSILTAWNKARMNALGSPSKSPAVAPETCLPRRERMDLLHDLGQDLLIGNSAGPAEKLPTGTRR